MIVLDTNVLSEPMRAIPSPVVLAWLASAEGTAITAISIGELLTGARILPAGKRREGLIHAIEGVLGASNRVLPYDEPAAREYARMQERRRLMGVPLAVEDGMIAAICSVSRAVLATRNGKDFVGLGVELIDPWPEGEGSSAP